ncbi:MAG: VacJ family lipoprotein [Alphaproteobacteria bacterium]|nr:VacJ family lipoprotein [Alphaproteobacteria bacterium]
MKKILLMVPFLLALTACMTNPDGTKMKVSDEETKLEVYNRAMFNFNYQADKLVLKPIAKGYKAVTTQGIRNRVTSFFNNLEEPAYAINDLLQGKVKNSGKAVARFAINSTLGLLGTFDVAAGWGIEKKKNSFDATMAMYCTPDGPFFVMPIIGPSTPRYLVGWSVDSIADPMYWALLDNEDEDWGVALSFVATGLEHINKRAENLEMLDGLEASSVDFYATVKSAFLQNRRKFESLCATQNEQGEVAASYDFDFENDED